MCVVISSKKLDTYITFGGTLWNRLKKQHDIFVQGGIANSEKHVIDTHQALQLLDRNLMIMILLCYMLAILIANII